MPTKGGKRIKKIGRRYDRDFKISVLTELEAGKSPVEEVYLNCIDISLRERFIPGLKTRVFSTPGPLRYKTRKFQTSSKNE